MGNIYVLALLSMTGLAVFFAAVLAFADKKLKVEDDPKVAVITDLLPGVNCGACGFLSCHDFAEHLVSDGIDPSLCRVVAEANRKTIYDIIGKEEKDTHPRIPLVLCAAECEQKEPEAKYVGIATCAAAELVFGGGMKCTYGCLGFGDCAVACSFDAFHMENGLPKVDTKKCTGCGKCVEACPRNIIEMQEKKNEKLFYVACSSKDDMMTTRKTCSVGCIACGVCVKLSSDGLFQVENNLAQADYSKQKDAASLLAIASKCPAKVIKEA